MAIKQTARYSPIGEIITKISTPPSTISLSFVINLISSYNVTIITKITNLITIMETISSSQITANPTMVISQTNRCRLIGEIRTKTLIHSSAIWPSGVTLQINSTSLNKECSTTAIILVFVFH
jgi:hypothetical protein